MFVPSFRPRSHVVDVHLENFPGLEEAGLQHGDALAGGPLERSAAARKHVVSDVTLVMSNGTSFLRQLGSPCYSGVAIGGVDKRQDTGYQGGGWLDVGRNLGVHAKVFHRRRLHIPPGSPVVQVLYFF